MVASRNRVGRNEKCPCGSGKKYKHCCLSSNGQNSKCTATGILRARRALPVPNRRHNSDSGWLELHFTAPMKDGSRLYLVLLYSEKWVGEMQIDLGTILEIHLPEIEFYGPITLGMIKDAETAGPIEGHLHLALHMKDEKGPGEVWVGNWKPAEEAEERERQNHRKIVFRMDHPDGSHIRMWLRRSLGWIAERKAEVGGKVFLELPEQGVKGWANVIEIRPWPKSRPGRKRGKRVTGFFCHSAGWAGDLKVASETEPIGVTPGHLFWSVDRNDWVSVGDLRVGERLKTLDGITHVEWYKMRTEPEPVYNIEVEDDHVYRVGESGILVHNASVPPPGKDYGCEWVSGDGRLEPCTSGLLNTSLGGCSTDYQAHHLIACSVRNTSALKRAAELGFDINGELNGWCLPSTDEEAESTKLPLHRGRHLSGTATDPNYFTCVASLLDGLENEYKSKVANDCNLCSKVAKVMKKIRKALKDHKIWLQKSDLNKGDTWKCPSY